jgi:hypothetical protein
MSFVIDKTVTDKAPKKTVVSQFTGNNSIVESTSDRTTCMEICDTVSETRRVAKSLRFPEDLDNTGDTTEDTGMHFSVYFFD